jgi:hypothetical protein
MPPALPEDTQAELKRDFARSFERFRGGGAIPIGGLVLSKGPLKPKFIVQCFSSKSSLENIARSEAQERIATAKEELAHLLSLFPLLREEIRALDVAFYFCYDDGKNAVCAAKEEDNQFVYHNR